MHVSTQKKKKKLIKAGGFILESRGVGKMDLAIHHDTYLMILASI